MTKLAERTNTWFIRPSTCVRPSADEHLYIFASLVSCLGPKVNSADLRIIHAYFRYLLLGCDPVTSTVKSLFNERQVEAMEKLLDFTGPRNISSQWNLLLDYLRDPRWLHVDINEQDAIRRSYMTLALTLLGEMKLPTVKMIQYDCLAFYQRHLAYKINLSASVEFSSGVPMCYASWLYGEIDALFKMGSLTMTEIWSTISYMAWFINLVRVERVHNADQRLELDHFGEVRSTLEGQVQLLKRALDTAPLKIDRPSPSSHLLNLLGIHPKKKVGQE